MRQFRPGFLVLGLLFVVVFAVPVQQPGCTQRSHLALTRALASGTARIDRDQATTCDKAWFGGHFYSVKAPGLAATALPAYALLGALDLRPKSPTTLVWLLNLLTVVPSALILLLLTARLADWVEPGSGTLAAVALGAGTLALPFATLWFGHLPSAALAFGAFFLLVRGKAALGDRRIDAAAGLLAGTAVLFDYPLGLVAIALLVYAIATRGIRAAAAYGGGAAIPAAALVAYNRWAFGSPTHVSYRDTVAVSGDTGHDVIQSGHQGFFGITWPSPHALAELLLSQRGLLTLTPVCLLGAFGVVALRRHTRAEAWFCGALVAAFLVYNSGLTLPFGGPFGGDTPGPRYLIAVLPFLLFPIGLAARAAPGATAALLAASVGAMALATATVPMVGASETHLWLDALRDGRFTNTVVTLFGGGNGWPAILPFVVAVAALVWVGVTQSLRRMTAPLYAAFEAACLLISWLLVVFASSRLFEPGRVAEGLIALGLAAALVAVAALWAREPHHRLPAATAP